MSLFKRNDSSYWWVRFIYNGRRIQHSTGTADQAKAQEYHDKLKASLWDQERLGVKPRRTWNEAVVKYLAETSHKASQSDDKTHLRWVDRFLNGVMLDRIDRELLDRIMTARKAEGVANSTVNRTLEVVRAVLRRAAFDWDWIAKAPRVRMLPEPKRRIRWLTREEADRLIGALPEHLAAMARFSLETGLRRANVTGLLWSQVDLTRRTAWVHADQAKARKAIAVPLSATAVIVIREQIGKHSTHVFSFRGRPVRQVNTKAWRQALKRVRYRRLSLARSAAYLGELACAGGNAVASAARVGRLASARDGVEVRASRQRPSCAVRRPHVRLAARERRGSGYVFGYRHQMRRACDHRKPLKIWRARQDSNPRPPGS
jgi:integrase